jgi:exo-beta-1,3-glucanase (GH17 family)
MKFSEAFFWSCMQLAKTKYFWVYAAVNLLLLIVISCWLYQQNQVVDMIAPSQLEENKVQCVSYAPYYGKEQSPFVKDMWIDPAQIDKDLQLLSTISHCVRTYSVGQGMDYVPEAASKLGLKVYLGAWIGWTDADNIKEIMLATEKANAYPDTVKALIIGNEVFLRQEQTEAAMQRYFTLAKHQSHIPITYADVWEFWVKHKNIAQYIDFHTVHILPYWENNPVAVADGTQHAEMVMQKMASLFTKPIIIGETGWPSVGRQRSESKPSLVNQARYIREFLQKADEKQWQYNLIEAIDQPWKRVLEGTVGGYWGLMTADLVPKFSLTGEVSERRDGYKLVVIAIVGAMIFLGLALCLKERRFYALLGLTALGALAGLNANLTIDYLIAACRDWIEWLALGGVAGLGMILILIQPWHISRPTQWMAGKIQLIALIFMYAALVAGALIYLDGRYRDFPIVLFTLPVLQMVASGFERKHATSLRWFTYGVPSALTVMFAVLIYEKEMENNAALIWLGLSVLLAILHWPRQQLKTTSSALG